MKKKKSEKKVFFPGRNHFGPLRTDAWKSATSRTPCAGGGNSWRERGKEHQKRRDVKERRSLGGKTATVSRTISSERSHFKQEKHKMVASHEEGYGTQRYTPPVTRII